jgi:crossover junction endodeoxyribonuclease RuvC
MIILGVDPGTAKTGYAVVEVTRDKPFPALIECACIDTASDVDMHVRLKQIYDNLLGIASKHNPELLVLEKLFFNTNVKTALTVGQARGVPLLVAAAKNMAVFEYTALEAKLVLTGYGRSSKQEMQEAVRVHMGFDKIIKPDDANDALAIVLCYLSKEKNGKKAQKKVGK